MNEPSKQDAPSLGAPRDADIGHETAALLLSGGKARDGGGTGATARVETTMDTPDELGGTGGTQEGGAG